MLDHDCYRCTLVLLMRIPRHFCFMRLVSREHNIPDETSLPNAATAPLFLAMSQMPSIPITLYVELGETTPRQRTIFRRSLLQSGWSSADGSGHAFSRQLNDVTSELQVFRLSTEHVHAAVAAADISDWAADCVCSGHVCRVSRNRRSDASN